MLPKLRLRRGTARRGARFKTPQLEFHAQADIWRFDFLIFFTFFSLLVARSVGLVISITGASDQPLEAAKNTRFSLCVSPLCIVGISAVLRLPASSKKLLFRLLIIVFTRCVSALQHRVVL